MALDLYGAGLRRTLAISLVSAVLAGCGGGGGGSSAASVGAATTAGTSDTPTASIALSAAEYAVPPASTAVLTINRSSSAGTATVGYSTTDGTAKAGADYAATSGTVTWSDGDSSAKTVSIHVSSAAGGKWFSLGLTSVDGNADFGSPAAATIQVSDSTTVPLGSSSSSSSGGSSSSSGSGSSGGSSTSSSSGSSGKAAAQAVTISWVAPTLNTNGTALKNLSGYVIFYGNSATAMTQKISIDTSEARRCVVTGLAPGTWYFDVVAVNAAGDKSRPSAVVSTTL